MVYDWFKRQIATRLFSVKTIEGETFGESYEKAKRSGYGKIVQSWFARYLDNIGITEKDKVFHSFRHTFETKATEKLISPQYQNAICGWVDQGVGQRVYAHKKDIRVMLEELTKINYPINRELSELKKSFMDSYVMRYLRTEK